MTTSLSQLLTDLGITNVQDYNIEVTVTEEQAEEIEKKINGKKG